LAEFSIWCRRDDAVFLDARAVPDEHSNVPAVVGPGDLRAEAGLRALPARVDRSRNDLLDVRVVGNGVDRPHPGSPAAQGRVAAADLLGRRGLDHLEGAVSASLEHRLDGFVAVDAVEGIVDVASDR